RRAEAFGELFELDTVIIDVGFESRLDFGRSPSFNRGQNRQTPRIGEFSLRIQNHPSLLIQFNRREEEPCALYEIEKCLGAFLEKWHRFEELVTHRPLDFRQHVSSALSIGQKRDELVQKLGVGCVADVVTVQVFELDEIEAGRGLADGAEI